ERVLQLGQQGGHVLFGGSWIDDYQDFVRVQTTHLLQLLGSYSVTLKRRDWKRLTLPEPVSKDNLASRVDKIARPVPSPARAAWSYRSGSRSPRAASAGPRPASPRADR